MFPRGRWLVLLWVALWLPAYAAYYPWVNFLNLCDLALVLTCIGIWRGSALLVSAPAVGMLLVCVAWIIDVGGRLLLARHVFGGTQYMWDATLPLWLRLLSLFHGLLPAVQLLALRRTGYDRRGFAAWSLFALAVLALSRLADPARNLNYAYASLFTGHPWGPGPVHVMATALAMAVGLHLPAHLLLRAVYPPPVRTSDGASRSGAAGGSPA